MDHRDSRGFTLVEMLAALAVLILLLSIGGLAAASLVTAQQQNRRDRNAETIYLVAQDNLSALSAADRLPEDTGKTAMLEGCSYCGEGTAPELAELFVPAGSTDAAYGHFIVEYSLETASVRGVFYSEEPFDYYSITPNMREDRELRGRYKLGYFGAEGGSRVESRNGTAAGTFTRDDAFVVAVSDTFSGPERLWPQDEGSLPQALTMYNTFWGGLRDTGNAAEAGDTARMSFCEIDGSCSFSLAVLSRQDLTGKRIRLDAYTAGQGGAPMVLKYAAVPDAAYSGRGEAPAAGDYVTESDAAEYSWTIGGEMARAESAASAGYAAWLAVYEITVTVSPDAVNSGGTGYFVITIEE